jgi:NDP-mannose synthase
MNGDTLTDMDYTALLDRHTRSGAAATIATTEREVQISLGVLHFDERNGGDDSHVLTGYTEKPQIKYQASMGVYCFSPEAIGHIESGERLDFPDLILRLLAVDKEVRGWTCTDYWLDIGRHDDYEQAQSEFDRMRDRLIPQE